MRYWVGAGLFTAALFVMATNGRYLPEAVREYCRPMRRPASASDAMICAGIVVTVLAHTRTEQLVGVLLCAWASIDQDRR